MSLPKVLAIGMVVGLVAMLISLAGVLAQGGEGTVTIRDSDDTNYSDLLSDMAHINFTGLDVLPAGQVYEGWLVNTDAAGAPVRAQSTGRFTVDSDGNADMTYLSSGDAAGENIVTEFTTFVLSIEPVDDPDPGPSDDKPFADSIPASALVHIRHLLSSWQGNPAYTVGRYAGDPKGIAVGLREQTSIALFRAGLSHRSDTLADVQVHACHTVNIIEGAEGANYDSSCGDPGDGFGVLKYAADTSLHASLSITGLDDAMITAHSREVAASAKQAGRWATDARDAALNAVATTDITAARLFAGNAESILTNALNGFDADADGTAERITGEGGAKQAYWAAQDMATFTLGGEAPPQLPEPPKTGDAGVPTVAKGALWVGGFLLVGGIGLLLSGLVTRRIRRSRA